MHVMSIKTVCCEVVCWSGCQIGAPAIPQRIAGLTQFVRRSISDQRSTAVADLFFGFWLICAPYLLCRPSKVCQIGIGHLCMFG